MAAKKKRKRPVPREGVDRPYAGGTWSNARMRSFIMSALRRAQWPCKYKAISRAFVRDGINPATGKKCKLHKCEECGEEHPKGFFHADHREPVIPIEHDWMDDSDSFVGYNWNEVMRRLWVEEPLFDILCHDCHAIVTNRERAERAEAKKLKL